MITAVYILTLLVVALAMAGNLQSWKSGVESRNKEAANGYFIALLWQFSYCIILTALYLSND
jgi:hypothetical protein